MHDAGALPLQAEILAQDPEAGQSVGATEYPNPFEPYRDNSDPEAALIGTAARKTTQSHFCEQPALGKFVQGIAECAIITLILVQQPFPNEPQQSQKGSAMLLFFRFSACNPIYIREYVLHQIFPIAIGQV